MNEEETEHDHELVFFSTIINRNGLEAVITRDDIRGYKVHVWNDYDPEPVFRGWCSDYDCALECAEEQLGE